MVSLRFNSFSHVLWGPAIAALPVLLLTVAGCKPAPLEFRSNELHTVSLSPDSDDSEVTRIAKQAAQHTQSLFGTPDQPAWPESLPLVLDMEKVLRCSGPVGRNPKRVEFGLYRKHCVQCHGITGDGLGPAASLLAPYPRDFRRGSFKFKSTPIGKKPTHADIVRVLEKGLPGTSMPSFKTLNNSPEFAEDIDALAHYVRYLAIRGEVERKLVSRIVAGTDIDMKELMLAAEQVVGLWQAAESFEIKVPEMQPWQDREQQRAAIENGKELFSSELTACSKCHGTNADGKGISQDFDDWTKDWTIRAGIDPTNKSEWRARKKYGALKPVIDPSRNLHFGGLRGGTDREDIYRRLVGGIEGSPMPAIARKENGNPGLTDSEIRDLVEYVHSLVASEAETP